MMNKYENKFKVLLVTIALIGGFFQLNTAQKSVAQTSKIIDAIQLLDDLKILSADDMQGRQFGTPSIVKARDFVEKRFKEAGLKSFGDSYLQPFEIISRTDKKVSGNNVVGFIKGKKSPDNYIVVTAH
jgi:hypothetical protein